MEFLQRHEMAEASASKVVIITALRICEVGMAMTVPSTPTRLRGCMTARRIAFQTAWHYSRARCETNLPSYMAKCHRRKPPAALQHLKSPVDLNLNSEGAGKIDLPNMESAPKPLGQADCLSLGAVRPNARSREEGDSGHFAGQRQWLRSLLESPAAGLL